ncbi:hypothetical protein D3C72_2480240 [compost metagenome]
MNLALKAYALVVEHISPAIFTVKTLRLIGRTHDVEDVVFFHPQLDLVELSNH